MNALPHGDFIKVQAHRQSGLEDRSLPRLNQHHYKELELLFCGPTILMPVPSRAVEGYRSINF
jgi:hypothetical protein